MADASLTSIMNKVRRLTRKPSIQQLSDPDLLQYINTFYTQDFPNWLKTRKLHSNFITFTVPFQDYVAIPENMIVELKTPIYVNGLQITYTQSQQEFFNLYPQQIYNYQIAIGDGVTTNFNSGPGNANAIPSAPFLISNYSTISFTSVDINNAGVLATDDYTMQGNFTAVPIIGTAIGGSTFNYLNGAYNVTFAVAPAVGQPIFCNTQPSVSNQPIPSVPPPPVGNTLNQNGPATTALYFNSTLYFRPVPTLPYEVKIEQDVYPTDLDAVLNNVPLLNQWWQYIAYGAARKVLQDYVDPDTEAIITPEFRNQERLVMRRVLNQLSQQRAQTRYTEPMYYTGYGWPYLQS